MSYLYKHDHPHVRDYLCNRIYSLLLSGIESYLFQICYMSLHKRSPLPDKFVVDICTKSLLTSLKVNWFLMAELEDSEDEAGNEDSSRIHEKCQIAATLMGEWLPLIVPPAGSPKNRPVSDENKLFRKLIPKVKVRDTLFFRKSVEKYDEELDKDEYSLGDCTERAGTTESRIKKGSFVGYLIKDYEESDEEGFFRRPHIYAPY